MPVAVQIREAGRAIASYPGRKLGKALDQWCEDNRDALDSVAAMFGGHRNKTDIGSVRACCLRALVRHPSHRERIAEFVECLKSGIVRNDRDSAVGVLYRWIMTNSRLLLGREGRREAYYKTASALSAFLEGRPLSKLYECDHDPFAAVSESLSKEKAT